MSGLLRTFWYLLHDAKSTNAAKTKYFFPVIEGAKIEIEFYE
jgi:hypothetical protein